MKKLKLISILLFVVFATAAFAQGNVANGYVRPNLGNEDTLKSEIKTESTSPVVNYSVPKVQKELSKSNTSNNEYKNIRNYYAKDGQFEAWGYYSRFNATDNLDGDYGGVRVSVRQKSEPDDPYFGVDASYNLYNFQYKSLLYDAKGFITPGYNSVGTGHEMVGMLSLFYNKSDETVFNGITLKAGFKKIKQTSNDSKKSSITEDYTSFVSEGSFDLNRDESMKTFNRVQMRWYYEYPLIAEMKVLTKEGNSIHGSAVNRKTLELSTEIAVLSFPFMKKNALVLSGVLAYKHVSSGLSVGLDPGLKDLWGFGGVISFYSRYSEVVRLEYREMYNKPGSIGGDRFWSCATASIDAIALVRSFMK